MTTRLTATSLLSRTLLRRVTSRTPTPLLGPIGLERSAGIPVSQPTRASSTASGDRGQEPPPPAMDSPIKVVSHLGGGRGGGEGEGGDHRCRSYGGGAVGSTRAAEP